MKKLVFIAIGLLMAGTSFLTVITPSSAIATGNTVTGTGASTFTLHWINGFQIQAVNVDPNAKPATITLMSQTQAAPRGSTQFSYTSSEKTGLTICNTSDYIDNVNPAGTQGTFHCDNGQGGSNAYSINIGNVSASSAYFNFKDVSTITTGNGRREFDFAGSASGNSSAVNTITISFNNSSASLSTPGFKYIYGENGSDTATGSYNNKCVSAIAIDTAATNADGSVQDKNPNAFLVVADDKSNPSTDSYPSFIISRLQNSNGSGWVSSGLDPNGCSYSTPIPIYVNAASTGPTAANQPTKGGAGGTSNGTADVCSTAGGSYAWILCPIVSSASTFLQGVYVNAVEPMLEISAVNKASSPGLYAVWQAMAGLADVVFVIVFLIIIFGTSFGLDAYTVKKVLPRLVIAAVAIQLSFFLCGILVDIGNILGGGIDSLITNALTLPPVGNAPPELAQNVIGAATGVLLGVGVVTAGIGALVLLGPTVLLLALGLALSVLVFVFSLIVRRILIYVLIILAPLAIVAWVLPNTQNLAKKWFQMLIRIIMVYPIISLMLGAAALVQKVGGTTGFIGALITGIAPIVVFFMMPMAFKWGGTAMALAGTVATKSGLGAGAKAAGAGGKAPFKKAWNDTKANRAANSAAKLNERASVKGFGGAAARFRLGGFATGAAVGMRAARVSSEQEKLDKQQQDAYAREYKGMDRDKLRGISLGDDIKGDSAQMRAIMAEMSESNDAAGLTSIMESGKFGSKDRDKVVTSQAWKKGMRGVSSDMKSNAPHLSRPNPYSGLGAAQMSKLNEHGWEQLRDYAKKHPESYGSIKEQIAEMQTNPTLRGDLNTMKNGQIALLNSESDAHTPSGTTTPPTIPPAGPPLTPPTP